MSARHLGGGSDGRSSGGSSLRLNLRLLSLSLLGGGLSGGRSLLLGSLGGLLSGGGLLFDSLLGGLLLGLGRVLALDGSTELGERALARLLLTLSGRRGLVTLAESEGERRLTLLLSLLLGGLGGGSGGGLSRLSRDGSRVGDIHSQRGSGLNRGDDGGSLGAGLLILGGLKRRLSRLVAGLLLLLGEDAAEEAVTLHGLVARVLSGLGLVGLGLLGGRDDRDSLGGSSELLLSLGSLSGLVLSDRLDNSGGLLGLSLVDLGLVSLGLLLLLLLLAEAEERSTLVLSGLLNLLSLGLLLGGLLRLLSLLSLGLVLRSLFFLGSLNGLLLLLGRSSRLEALKRRLVGLALSDGSSKLLRLGNLELKLGNPVVTLSGVGSLEGVLVALGGQGELIGALNFRLSGIGLFTC